jgi:hypothetical protein
MEAAAHTKGGFGGVPQKVGKEFVKADKRLPKGNIVKKVKKMADGGISGLGDMVGNRPPDTPTFGDGGKDYGGGGGGGSATDGLSTVNRGAQNIGSALSRASAAIGGGGGTGGGGDITTPTMPLYKKGGHVTTRRMSTCSPSKKSPNW